jgi:hypothetical protein
MRNDEELLIDCRKLLNLIVNFHEASFLIGALRFADDTGDITAKESRYCATIVEMADDLTKEINQRLTRV